MDVKLKSKEKINKTNGKNKASENKTSLSILVELFKFIQPYKGRVIAALVALIFTASLTLSVGHGVRILIDQGFTQQSVDDLANAIQFILVITVLISIGTFFPFLFGFICRGKGQRRYTTRCIQSRNYFTP